MHHFDLSIKNSSYLAPEEQHDAQVDQSQKIVQLSLNNIRKRKFEQSEEEGSSKRMGIESISKTNCSIIDLPADILEIICKHVGFGCFHLLHVCSKINKTLVCVPIIQQAKICHRAFSEIHQINTPNKISFYQIRDPKVIFNVLTLLSDCPNPNWMEDLCQTFPFYHTLLLPEQFQFFVNHNLKIAIAYISILTLETSCITNESYVKTVFSFIGMVHSFVDEKHIQTWLSNFAMGWFRKPFDFQEPIGEILSSWAELGRDSEFHFNDSDSFFGEVLYSAGKVLKKSPDSFLIMVNFALQHKLLNFEAAVIQLYFILKRDPIFCEKHIERFLALETCFYSDSEQWMFGEGFDNWCALPVIANNSVEKAFEIIRNDEYYDPNFKCHRASKYIVTNDTIQSLKRLDDFLELLTVHSEEDFECMSESKVAILGVLHHIKKGVLDGSILVENASPIISHLNNYPFLIRAPAENPNNNYLNDEENGQYLGPGIYLTRESYAELKAFAFNFNTIYNSSSELISNQNLDLIFTHGTTSSQILAASACLHLDPHAASKLLQYKLDVTCAKNILEPIIKVDRLQALQLVTDNVKDESLCLSLYLRIAENLDVMLNSDQEIALKIKSLLLQFNDKKHLFDKMFIYTVLSKKLAYCDFLSACECIEEVDVFQNKRSLYLHAILLNHTTFINLPATRLRKIEEVFMNTEPGYSFSEFLWKVCLNPSNALNELVEEIRLTQYHYGKLAKAISNTHLVVDFMNFLAERRVAERYIADYFTKLNTLIQDAYPETCEPKTKLLSLLPFWSL